MESIEHPEFGLLFYSLKEFYAHGNVVLRVIATSIERADGSLLSPEQNAEAKEFLAARGITW